MSTFASWKEELHPGRCERMSGKMAAIVGYISDETYTDPAINELVVTSDGFVLIEHFGEVGANHFIGGDSDLLRNWNSLLDAARLTPEAEAACPLIQDGLIAANVDASRDDPPPDYDS